MIKTLSQRGSILPLTLIIIAILTSFAVTLSQQARSTLKETQQQQQQWQNELQYRSLLQNIIQILLVGKKNYNEATLDKQQIFIDGRLMTINELQVQVQETSGLLGLAIYQPEWVLRLLQQATDATTAIHIRDELGDWIDKNSIKQRFGMESSDYALAKKAYKPRNTPLRHLDELLELPSMTAAIYNKKLGLYPLREHLLAGGGSHINVATATKAVLKAVFNLRPKKLQNLLIAREKQDWKAVKRLLPQYHLAYDEFGPFIGSAVYRIKISKKNAPTLSTIIRLTPFKSPPYQIQLWHYPDNERGWTN